MNIPARMRRLYGFCRADPSQVGQADLQGATPVVSVSGWNVPTIDISA